MLHPLVAVLAQTCPSPPSVIFAAVLADSPDGIVGPARRSVE